MSTADNYGDTTPMQIDEDDDAQTAVNGDADDAGEFLTWDRDKHGRMADHATDPQDEPEVQHGDDCEKGE